MTGQQQETGTGTGAASGPTGPTANPLGPFNISVLIPENIEVRMVNASALADYEIWIFIASLLSNAVVGFAVAYSQAIDAHSASKTYVGWTLTIFCVLFVVAILRAGFLRYVLSRRGKSVKLGVSSAAIDPGNPAG